MDLGRPRRAHGQARTLDLETSVTQPFARHRGGPGAPRRLPDPRRGSRRERRTACDAPRPSDRIGRRRTRTVLQEAPLQSLPGPSAAGGGRRPALPRGGAEERGDLPRTGATGRRGALRGRWTPGDEAGGPDLRATRPARTQRLDGRVPQRRPDFPQRLLSLQGVLVRPGTLP